MDWMSDYPFWTQIQKDDLVKGPSRISQLLKSIGSISLSVQAKSGFYTFYEPSEENGQLSRLLQVFRNHQDEVGVADVRMRPEDIVDVTAHGLGPLQEPPDQKTGGKQNTDLLTFLLVQKSFLVTLIAKLEVVLVQEDGAPSKEDSDRMKQLKSDLEIVVSCIDGEMLEAMMWSHPKERSVRREALAEKEKSIFALLDGSTLERFLRGTQELRFADFMADIVGMRRDVVRSMLDLDSFSLKHNNVEDFILDHFDFNRSEDLLRAEHFWKLGFTPDRSKFLSDLMTGFEGSPLPELEYARDFIETIFTYNPLLSDGIDRPTRPEKETDLPYQMECFGANETKKKITGITTTRIPTTRGDGAESSIVPSTYGVLNEPPPPGFARWFHGTHEEAFTSILSDGILVKNGARKRDFSHCQGFYLSDNLDRALKHTQKFRLQNTAVLRYTVPESFLQAYQGLDLSVNDPTEKKKWQEVIRHFRSGESYGSSGLKMELKQAAYICGPVSHDGKWQANPEWPSAFNASWRQLCICAINVGEKLNAFLDLAVFIQVAND